MAGNYRSLKTWSSVWYPNISIAYFTRPEIERLHLHFFHPSATKLFNLLRRSKNYGNTGDLRKLIEEVSNACSRWRENSSPPFRFRASIAENEIIYNHEPAIDLLWLDGNPVLHVVETQTFSKRNTGEINLQKVYGMHFWNVDPQYTLDTLTSSAWIRKLHLLQNYSRNWLKCTALNFNFWELNPIITLDLAKDITLHFDMSSVLFGKITQTFTLIWN